MVEPDTSAGVALIDLEPVDRLNLECGEPSSTRRTTQFTRAERKDVRGTLRGRPDDRNFAERVSVPVVGLEPQAVAALADPDGLTFVRSCDEMCRCVFRPAVPRTAGARKSRRSCLPPAFARWRRVVVSVFDVLGHVCELSAAARSAARPKLPASGCEQREANRCWRGPLRSCRRHRPLLHR